MQKMVRRIRRPISDAEDVVKTHTTYVKKFVLLADSEDPAE